MFWTDQTHVMLDLETLGENPGCVILSLGAVAFRAHADTGDCEIWESYQQFIDVVSSERAGLKVEARTTLWWLEQSEAARADLLQNQSVAAPLDAVLEDFARWLSGVTAEGSKLNLWANAPTFDCAILNEAYKAVGKARPWKYSAERCYRTLKALRPDIVAAPRTGVHHSALADAEHQARHAVQLLRSL